MANIHTIINRKSKPINNKSGNNKNQIPASITTAAKNVNPTRNALISAFLS